MVSGSNRPSTCSVSVAARVLGTTNAATFPCLVTVTGSPSSDWTRLGSTMPNTGTFFLSDHFSAV